jgi:hypothetical protein
MRNMNDMPDSVIDMDEVERVINFDTDLGHIDEVVVFSLVHKRDGGHSILMTSTCGSEEDAIEMVGKYLGSEQFRDL